MEQAAAQYWMLMKRKQEIVKNKVLHSQTCNEETSWEERAFEKDHAAVMWPPRSYSCSFCKREFRSAQALGGHMNVHRRDRARLKQSLHLDPISSSIISPPSRVSSTTHDHHHAYRSWSSSGGAIKVLRVQDSTRGHGDDDDKETDFSVGLMIGCKRPKLAVSSPSSSLLFPLKPCLQAADMNISLKASSMEDLDLELRLGHDPQQVK